MSSVFLCKCCCAPVIFLLSWCPKNPARKVSFLFVRHVLSTHFSIWPSGLGFFSSVWVVTFDIACTSSQDIFNSSSSNRLPILQRSANLLSRLFDSYLFFWWSRIVKASRTSRYGFSQAHCCHQFLSHCKFFFLKRKETGAIHHLWQWQCVSVGKCLLVHNFAVNITNYKHWFLSIGEAQVVET